MSFGGLFFHLITNASSRTSGGLSYITYALLTMFRISDFFFNFSDYIEHRIYSLKSESSYYGHPTKISSQNPRCTHFCILRGVWSFFLNILKASILSLLIHEVTQFRQYRQIGIHKAIAKKEKI